MAPSYEEIHLLSDSARAQGRFHKFAGIVALFGLVAVAGGTGYHLGVKASAPSKTFDSTGIIQEASSAYQVRLPGTNACPQGLDITTSEECESAAASLPEVLPHLTGKMWVGTHAHMPRYCAIDTSGADMGLKFGGAASGGITNADVSPICKVAAPTAAPAVDATSHIYTKVSPASISASTATDVTFTGSAIGDKFSWSAAGALDCSGVTPATSITSSNEVVSVTLSGVGTYKLCVASGGRVSPFGHLTVQAATSAHKIIISPASIGASTATDVTFTGSAIGDKFSWSEAGASDCSGVTPATSITSANGVASVTLSGVGVYKLCYRASGGSDSVVQILGDLTVQAKATKGTCGTLSGNAALTLTVCKTLLYDTSKFPTACAADPCANADAGKCCTAITSRISVRISPASISTSTVTAVTFTGSANGDKFSWSAAGASDCSGVTPATLITKTDEAVSVTQANAGTYKLCYRKKDTSDSVLQTNGDLTVQAPSSATQISISPTRISATTATAVTFTGSAKGDKFSWSAAGASTCSGVTPATLITKTDEEVSVTQANAGTYKLCYQKSGGSASVLQTNGDLTVQAATNAAQITISPTKISAGTATDVTFTGSANGDKFSWSAAGAADCTGVTPATLITKAHEAVSVTLPAGAFKLCYQASGGSDSKLQTSALTVQAATPGNKISIAPATIKASATTAVTFTGSAIGDKFSWSAAGASDCSGVTPATSITAADEAVQVTLSGVGAYNLCYRLKDGSDSVLQTGAHLTVQAV